MDMEQTTTSNPEAEALRRKAAECYARSAESFARCDTDGFLSQWASDISAQEYLLQADIIEAGGKAQFLGLFDADNRRIRARLVSRLNGFNGRYEPVWVCLDEFDRPTFVNSPRDGFNPSPRSKMFRLGLHEDFEMAPAYADIRGNSAVNCRAVAVRNDAGYPEDAIVLERNQA